MILSQSPFLFSVLTIQFVEPKKATRPRLPEVQVEATPATDRYRNVPGLEPLDSRQAGRQPQSGLLEEERVPPSSASLIPGTGPRPGHKDVRMQLLTSDHPTATPVQGSLHNRRLTWGNLLSIPPSSPLVSRQKGTPLGYDVATPVLSNASAMAAKRSLFQTPLKQQTTGRSRAELSELGLSPSPATAAKVQEVSIYKRLGWDDDNDL